jgi:hypothetical protein
MALSMNIDETNIVPGKFITNRFVSEVLKNNLTAARELPAGIYAYTVSHLWKVTHRADSFFTDSYLQQRGSYNPAM